ncbi:homeodomain super [Cladophialophora chaetospira]|uniref:Homeodomain super n=1 Tax=Cladophialophora chaetospira TaxID=386627 RepID=A0AA38WZR2_9EURO|nr:homeodomain super [Cladophialophora chaetospira]
MLQPHDASLGQPGPSNRLSQRDLHPAGNFAEEWFAEATAAEQLMLSYGITARTGYSRELDKWLLSLVMDIPVMGARNPYVEDFPSYRDDHTMQSFPLETADPCMIWQAFDDCTLDLGSDRLNQNMSMSELDGSFLENTDDALWFRMGDALGSSVLAIAPDDSIAGSLDQVETVDRSQGKEKSNYRHRLTGEQTAALGAWLTAHLFNPYPTESEKLELATRTGLSKKQIEDWFSRTRQRKLPKPTSCRSVRPHPPARSPQQSLEVLPAHSVHSQPSRDGDLPDTASQVNSDSDSIPEPQFERFRGSMLSWWIDAAQRGCASLKLTGGKKCIHTVLPPARGESSTILLRDCLLASS